MVYIMFVKNPTVIFLKIMLGTLSIYLCMYVYMYVGKCVCVCVCVSVYYYYLLCNISCVEL